MAEEESPPPGVTPDVLPEDVTISVSSAEARAIFDKLFDEGYFKKLKSRLDAGDLPANVECLLLRYRMGEPTRHPQRVTDAKRFAEMRARLKKFREDNPEKSRLLDLVVQSENAVDAVSEDPPHGKRRTRPA